MDSGYLIERGQIQRALARTAISANARAAQEELADCYRALIDSHRRPRLVASGLGPQPRPPAS